MLPFLGMNQYGHQAFCWFRWNDHTALGSAYVIFFNMEGLIMMGVLILCNIVAMRELIKMQRGPNSTNESRPVQTEFILLMILVSILFIICTTPLLIRTTCAQLSVAVSQELDFLAMRFFITNSAVNPHVYWVLRLVVGKKLLTRAKRRLQDYFGKHSAKVDTRPTITTDMRDITTPHISLTI